MDVVLDTCVNAIRELYKLPPQFLVAILVWCLVFFCKQAFS